MAVEISAVFDTPDSAELALGRLRDNKIILQSYSIEPLRYYSARASQTQTFVYPMGMFNGIGTGMGGGSGIGMAAYTSGPSTGIPKALGDSEIASREVILSAFVPERDSTRARSVLISAHGHRVKVLS